VAAAGAAALAPAGVPARAALAIGFGFALAQVVPWSSRDYWILLTITVVLRGSLAQTLTRRNERVLGTLVGSLLAVLLLALQPPLGALLFVVIVAQGVAHAFVVRRYVITAVAASVLGLVMTGLLRAGGSPAFDFVARIGDTLMGAAIAWGFSYVLPAWERGQLTTLVQRACGAMARHARHSLALAALTDITGQPELDWRLARRDAYDVLSALVQATERALAEPRAVRPPTVTLERLQGHAYQLLGQLSAIHSILLLRRERLRIDLITEPIAAAAERIATLLDLSRPCDGPAARPDDAASIELRAIPEALPDRFVPDSTPWLFCAACARRSIWRGACGPTPNKCLLRSRRPAWHTDRPLPAMRRAESRASRRGAARRAPLNMPAESLQSIFQRLHAAQAAAPCPDWRERRRLLQALRAVITEHLAEICAAIDADFGCRPPEETKLLEAFPALDGIAYAQRRVRRWMRPRRQWAGFWFLPARTELRPQPVGVAGILVPWNYPLYLAVGPITDALAAGNRVMVKPSEYTPRFSALFAQLIARHFPAGEVVVVNGNADVAAAFARLPFGHLLFTGSTAVGRQVMRAAAGNLTPVTLELGGKSPAILGPGARFDHAVERIVYGKSVNAGQTCIAPDYVLLPRAREGEFVAKAKAAFARLYPDYAERGDYASVIDARRYAALLALRDEAVAGGAHAHPLAAPADDAARRHLPPTLLTRVAPDARVMHEEVFGPLLPIVPYDTLDDALAYVAARPHPLSLYLFDDDRRVQRRVLERSLAGGVTLNDTLYHIAQHHLPFGGVGDSGMGAYHGEAGFRTFSKLTPVFRQARWNAAGLLNPPYGPRVRRLLQLLLRR
jgi:coniferyl-aldehyde dehydrogenase